MNKLYSILFKWLLAFLWVQILPTVNVFAQADTAFWFAAPYVAKGGWDGRLADRPIVVRIVTQNQAAEVVIQQPAGGGMPVQNLSVPANSSQRIDVTPWINNIENYPANTVLDYGIEITSDVPVVAYYQVESFMSGGMPSPPDSRCSPELFNLKGRLALGKEFTIPSQFNYYNDTISSSALDDARNSFIVVASEDNTTVTITPSHSIVGHAAGVPFTLQLNKGQTYAAVAQYATAASHLQGSKVVADKPIAVTVSDDHVEIVGGDLAGDQIVANKHLGTEYVVLNGKLGSGNVPVGAVHDHIFITATENATQIAINGSNVTVLNANESYSYGLNGDDAAYVTSSHPVAVWHCSGISGQIGASEVPRLNCAGSQSVSFARTLIGPLLINIVVPKGAEDRFALNGDTTIIAGNLFSPVPGTNGNWLYCRFDVNDLLATAYPYESVITVDNSAAQFQLSVVNGCKNPTLYWGANLSYFSSYAAAEGESVNILGADTAICPGVSLMLDASMPGATGYSWSTGETTPSITIDAPGVYWVHVNGDFCGFTDTIQVFSKPSIKDLGPDTAICLGFSITLDATTNGATGYLWSTGETTASISVNTPGTYWVHVDGDLCVKDDTIHISEKQIQPIELGNDTTICAGQKVVLSAVVPSDAGVLWSTGETSASIIVQDSGDYWIKVGYPGCGDVSDTISVGWMYCDCFVGIPNVFSPNDDGRNDVFMPVFGAGCAIQYYDLRIYNRYGQLVFESHDPNVGWDGKQNGKKADLGVYMFYLVYKEGVYNTKVVRKGDITLIR